MHPAACVRSTGELFADLEGQPRAQRATVSVNHLTYRRTFPLRSVAPRLQNRVPLSTLAVTGRSPTFTPRHRAPCGYQRSHGLQASSGPGESYCGPAVVRINCVSRQQSLDDADPISERQDRSALSDPWESGPALTQQYRPPRVARRMRRCFT